MKILVIGGVHGNEPLGINLVNLLSNSPIAGVDALIANPRATKKQTRFTQSDLNRSFGKKQQVSYEGRRATKLEQTCRQYDLVLDFHNTQSRNNNCSFIGSNASSILTSVSSLLGLNRCIVATYDCINKYCSNVLSVEISLTSTLNDSRYWYQKIKVLASTGLVNSDSGKPLLYEYLRRVTWKEYNDLQLEWKAFQPISEQDKLNLSVSGIIAPIFIGSKYTEYYATLIRRITGNGEVKYTKL